MLCKLCSCAIVAAAALFLVAAVPTYATVGTPPATGLGTSTVLPASGETEQSVLTKLGKPDKVVEWPISGEYWWVYSDLRVTFSGDHKVLNCVRPSAEASRIRSDRIRQLIGQLGCIGSACGPITAGAQKELLAIGRDAVPALIDALVSQDRHDRTPCLAAQTLGRIGDPIAAQPIIKLLDSPEPAWRSAAAQALGEMRHQPAAASLAKCVLTDSDTFTRCEAAAALVKIGSPVASAVTPLLTSDNATARRLGAVILSRTGETGQLASLAAFESEESKSAIAEKTAGVVVAQISPQVWPLLEALQDPSNHVRRMAVDALGDTHAPSVVGVLIALLGDDGVRDQARDALPAIGAPAVKPLIEALSRDSWSGQQAAALALGRTHDPQAVSPLVVFMRRGNDAMAATAAESLATLGPVGVAQLVVFLRTQEPYWLSYLAANALGLVKDTSCLDALYEAATHKYSFTRQSAVTALGKVGPLAVPQLIACLQNGDKEVRKLAAKSLGDSKDARAVKPLITALSDSEEEVRCAAAKALWKTGSPALSGLAQATQNSNGDVVWGALTALQLIGTPEATALVDSRAGSVPFKQLAQQYRVAMHDQRPESGCELVLVLLKYGNKNMAEDFLNSKSSLLSWAASCWAEKNSYSLIPGVPRGIAHP